jgi:eukaryotic-like serine/threonine-protein kinase
VTPNQWQRAKELFSAAVGLADVEREPFLQAQAESSEIITEVRSLLATYEESPGFLDEASPEIPAKMPCAFNSKNEQQKLAQRLEAFLACQRQSLSNSTSGEDTEADEFAESEVADYGILPERIGPYKILRILGEGGMGIAYLAERDDGVYRQQVAIKVLKGGSHAPALVRRFQNERQVLAGLEHPSIARLIDGGTTPSGQPYYAMEYAAGESVIRYAESHCLGLRERLTLFAAICDAVSAAHRQLVIHGDIKPANILVGPDGSPKLLDFGLSRIIQPVATDVTMSMVLLTPGYASPEQVRGERLSTATDIYSLGVLLFELLTGESPYGEAASSPLELCRAICNDDPCKPSASKNIMIRGVTPRRLRGDLDHIALKALRKSPDERYASVVELRADIQRHLGGFPVEAARGTTLYHFRKFVVRRRWLVTLATSFLLLATAAALRIWRDERIAELRFNQVRQLAHAMVFDVHDAIEEVPGSTMARKLLVDRALEYLKGLEITSGHNRGLELDLARAYTKIGTVQATTGGASLEDCAAGIQNLEHARSLLHDILQRSSADEEAAQILVDADLEASSVRGRRGEMTEWRALRAESISLLNSLAARHPQDLRLRLRAMTSVANTFDGEHNAAAALKAYEDVLSVARQAPSDSDTRLLEARTERDIAEQLQALRNMRAALDHHRAALRILQGLLSSFPANTRFRLETSWAYTETAWVEHDFHDERAAFADFNRAMQLLRAMAAADPSNLLARLEIGKLEMTETETVELVCNPRSAAEGLQDAMSIFADALKLDPTNDDVRVHMAQAGLTSGDLQVRIAHGRWSAGMEAYRQALQVAYAVKDDYPATSVFNMRELRATLKNRISACESEPAQ